MSSNATLFDIWNLIAAIIIAAMMLSNLSGWLRSRAYAQRVAAEALRDHLQAVDQIIDDPALPLPLVQFVADFNSAVGSERNSRLLYRVMLSSQGEKVRETDLSDALSALAKTRPDLAEGVLKVISKGLLCMLYRLSPTVKQVDDFLACLATEPRREIQVASKYVKSQHLDSSRLVAA